MEGLRSVRVGVAIGFITVLFGILWAIYLSVNHEEIERGFEEKLKASPERVLGGEAHSHDHSHDAMAHGPESAPGPEGTDIDGIVEEAHEMLVRGHLHAMGLGTLAIVSSLTLGFLNASALVRVVGSLFFSIGGFFYPFSLVLLGYRIPVLGVEAAERSVFPIVGVSIGLMIASILITIFHLLGKGFSRG